MDRPELLNLTYDAITAPNARLQIEVVERHHNNEVEIFGNPEGLLALAALYALAEPTTEHGEHHHLDEDFWGTELGSARLTVTGWSDDWPDWKGRIPSEPSWMG